MEEQWKEHQGAVLDTVDAFKVIDCTSCAFKHIVPIPSEEELRSVYKDDYYVKEKPYYIDRLNEDEPWWRIVFGERIDTFEQLLGCTGRVLDVGCGAGHFLRYAKERGWEAKGIEPSNQTASYAKDQGLDVVHGFLDAATADGLGRFDVVYLSEVLEHIPDPAALLTRAGACLEKGGLLCVIVPNDYSPFQDALRKSCDYEPWWVVPPHHINYFDFDSLSALMQRVGFEPVHRESSFPIDMFLLMGDRYVGDDKMGRVCHGKRKQFEEHLVSAGHGNLKRKLYQAMASLGLGRDAMVIGRKK